MKRQALYSSIDKDIVRLMKVGIWESYALHSLISILMDKIRYVNLSNL